jgi:hypothetical protein
LYAQNVWYEPECSYRKVQNCTNIKEIKTILENTYLKLDANGENKVSKTQSL